MAKKLEKGEKLIMEKKYDGMRTQIHYRSGETEAFSRSKKSQKTENTALVQ